MVKVIVERTYGEGGFGHTGLK